MPDKELSELSEEYLRKSEKTLSHIPVYLNEQDYSGAANRAYYAAFYAIKAIEILDGFDSKKV